jgi:hypothetical protein
MTESNNSIVRVDDLGHFGIYRSFMTNSGMITWNPITMKKTIRTISVWTIYSKLHLSWWVWSSFYGDTSLNYECGITIEDKNNV